MCAYFWTVLGKHPVCISCIKYRDDGEAWLTLNGSFSLSKKIEHLLPLPTESVGNYTQIYSWLTINFVPFKNLCTEHYSINIPVDSNLYFMDK